MNKQLLRVLAGSRAHGLNTDTSDYDYRGVFVMPTDEVFWDHAMGKRQRASESGKQEDDVNYEVGHFCKLALNSNPSILEVLMSPVTLYASEEGEELKGLFEHFWSSKGVYNAFGGYAVSSLKEYKKTGRLKAAVSAKRMAYTGATLLLTGEMNVMINNTKLRDVLMDMKTGEFEDHDILDLVHGELDYLDYAYRKNTNKKNNPEAVKEFLIKLRMNNV